MTQRTTIWKYSLETVLTVGHGTIALPAGARLIAVQAQRNVPQLWAMVDPDAPREARHFAIVGTGHAFNSIVDNGNYLGTFQMHGGALVFHAFEVHPATEEADDA